MMVREGVKYEEKYYFIRFLIVPWVLFTLSPLRIGKVTPMGVSDEKCVCVCTYLQCGPGVSFHINLDQHILVKMTLTALIKNCSTF